jgi:hypothetical protein
LALSVFFPLGLSLDMFVGIISVALIEDTLLGVPAGEGLDYSDASFLVVFLTTLVQGFFLNMILLAYMAGIYVLQWSWAMIRTKYEGLRTKQ